MDLIKNSKCVFSLTGTVAIESAILGKPSVTFGSTTWYSGCPNTIIYSKSFTFNQINSIKILSAKDVYEFLNDLMTTNSIPGFINLSQKQYFKQFDNKDFKASSIARFRREDGFYLCSIKYGNVIELENNIAEFLIIHQNEDSSFNLEMFQGAVLWTESQLHTNSGNTLLSRDE